MITLSEIMREFERADRLTDLLDAYARNHPIRRKPMNISAIATITGPTLTEPLVDTLFTDTVETTAALATILGLSERIFGAPTFEVDATETTTGVDVAMKAHFGPLTVPFKLPFVLPDFVLNWVSGVAGAGYAVDLKLTVA